MCLSRVYPPHHLDSLSASASIPSLSNRNGHDGDPEATADRAQTRRLADTAQTVSDSISPGKQLRNKGYPDACSSIWQLLIPILSRSDRNYSKSSRTCSSPTLLVRLNHEQTHAPTCGSINRSLVHLDYSISRRPRSLTVRQPADCSLSAESEQWPRASTRALSLPRTSPSLPAPSVARIDPGIDIDLHRAQQIDAGLVESAAAK